MKLNTLLLLIQKLETKIPHREVINPQLSSVNVAWHIEHTLIATIIITGQLVRSDPANYKWHFNKNRLLVLGMCKIPRGKGKAPKSVVPKEKSSLARIEKYMEIAKEKINATDGLNPRSFIDHPYLGLLNYKSSIRFMCIHAKHHLDIIDDILKAKHDQL